MMQTAKASCGLLEDDMDELIPIAQRLIGTETIPTANARDLHAFLGISKDYNAWMRQQIKRARLVEGRDFVTYQEVGLGQRGKPRIDYFVTFNAAQHVGLISGSEKGYEVREYFIACERQLRERPATHGDMLVEMAQAYRRLEARQDQDRQLLIANQQATITAQADALQAKDDALQAKDDALQARALALQALQDQQWVTIHQYVVQNRLGHQMPEAAQRTYGTWLAGYCLERRLHVYKIGMINGWDINTYHGGAIRETIEGWLVRQSAQQPLTLVH